MRSLRRLLRRVSSVSFIPNIVVLSKANIKFIRSLEQKKYRKAEGAFIAEGFKSVNDLLDEGWEARIIVATDEWQHRLTSANGSPIVIRVTDEELRKVSLLQHPQQVLAVFCLPSKSGGIADDLDDLCLCLDGVQDPGNLGTIIRTADWFGIRNIICSPATADAFNPKVVQATMGSIARVRVHYTDLVPFLKSLPSDMPVYGTLLDGENIYDTPLSNRGIIIMGNEGNGVTPEVRTCLTHKLLIPQFEGTAQPSSTSGPESLNVSIATAIILSEFRRR